MSTFGITNEDVRQHRNDVIAVAKTKMTAEAITQPVRLEFSRLKSDDTFEGITPVGKSGNVWLVAPEPGKRRTGNVKVERLGDEWTCSHKGWKAKEQCLHIKRVRNMLGEEGVVPYDGRRRRPLTKTLYATGPSEDTRRAKARAIEPIRVPELALHLCREFTVAPSRSTTHPSNRGANGAPYALRAYALLRKVYGNVSYEQLRARMSEDGVFWEGFDYCKAAVPARKTFIDWFGDSLLTGVLETLFVATTLPTRRFDTMVVGDSHDIPTRMVDNSRDRKFGPQPAAYRNPNRELVRQHFAVGKVSGIIYAADTTLRTGPGSYDGIHLPSLLEQTKARSETVAAAAFDKAYGGRANFSEAERLGVKLYVREKSGENRTDPSWPQMARELAALERSNPAEYAEAYRFRSKAEGTPSRIKARNPHIRLRRRKGDPVPDFPADVGEKKIADLSKEVQSALFDAASRAVGVARLNESLAILIVANLRTLNVLEHLYDQRVVFDKINPTTLNPPLELSERELYEVA